MFRYGAKRIGGRLMPNMGMAQQDGASSSNPGGGGSGGNTDPPAPLPAPTVSAVTPLIIVRLLGGTLTIKGDNFQPGAWVTVGGKDLTTTYVDAMTLTAVLPSALLIVATYTVVVTNPDNQSGQMANVLVISLL